MTTTSSPFSTKPLKETPVSRRFLIFLMTVSTLIGGLSAVYYEAKLKVIPQKAFSTQEIAKTNRLNRILGQKEAQNMGLEAEILLLSKRLQQTAPAATQANPNLPTGTAKPQSYQTLLRLNGLTTAIGTGVEITLEDAKRPVFIKNEVKRDNPNLGIIHNQDLLAVINQLWASGAESIAVNNQRLTATSAINCAGPVITINKTRITAPFKIQVLGNTQKILATLNSKESYLKYLSSYGMPSSVVVKEMALPTSPLKNSKALR